ncbi:MAG: hypothetical protein ABL907_11240, partial [Hyphomicrobium sp.]
QLLKAEAEAKAEAQRKAAADKKRLDDAKRAEDKKKRDEADRKRREDVAKKKKQEDEKRKLAQAQNPKDSLADLEQFIKPALKDNDPRKRAAPMAGSEVANAANVKGPVAGAPEGRDSQLTTSEKGHIQGLMRSALRRCWTFPAGADGADAIVTEVEFRLAPNGQLIGTPKVVSRVSTPMHSILADNAVRAIIQCAPYANFPPQLYKGGWDHFIWDFDPRSR